MGTREKAIKYRTKKWLSIIRECQARGIESSDVIHTIVPITVLKDDIAVKQKDASHQNSCIILNEQISYLLIG